MQVDAEWSYGCDGVYFRQPIHRCTIADVRVIIDRFGMVMVNREVKRYHTLPQIILSAMAGWTTALIVKAQIK
jgi:hypothetical protein